MPADCDMQQPDLFDSAAFDSAAFDSAPFDSAPFDLLPSTPLREQQVYAAAGILFLGNHLTF